MTNVAPQHSSRRSRGPRNGRFGRFVCVCSQYGVLRLNGNASLARRRCHGSRRGGVCGRRANGAYWRGDAFRSRVRLVGSVVRSRHAIALDSSRSQLTKRGAKGRRRLRPGHMDRNVVGCHSTAPAASPKIHGSLVDSRDRSHSFRWAPNGSNHSEWFGANPVSPGYLACKLNALGEGLAWTRRNRIRRSCRR